MTLSYPLQVSSLTRFSSEDYPGHVAAVVFCDGGSRSEPAFSWREIAEWLDSRHGLLDAVVFCGREALNQPGLASAMHAVRTMGYHVGLRVTFAAPDRLAAVLPLVDWVCMDIKDTLAHQRALSIVQTPEEPRDVHCAADRLRIKVAKSPNSSTHYPPPP